MSLYSDSNFYGGLTENLSAGGVFVATHSPRPIGEELEVMVTSPSNFTVKAKGVVRWQRPFVETSNMPPGMGIQFIQVEGQAEIEKFLRRRDPLYYDD